MGLLYLYQRVLHFYYSATIMPSQSIRRQVLCTYKSKLEVRSHNHRCHGKAIGVTYYWCVAVELVIQHEERLRLIILLSVVICLYQIIIFFPNYLLKCTICDKKVL